MTRIVEIDSYLRNEAYMLSSICYPQQPTANHNSITVWKFCSLELTLIQEFFWWSRKFSTESFSEYDWICEHLMALCAAESFHPHRSNQSRSDFTGVHGRCGTCQVSVPHFLTQNRYRRRDDSLILIYMYIIYVMVSVIDLVWCHQLKSKSNYRRTDSPVIYNASISILC